MPRRFSLKARLLSLLLSAAMVLMFLPASAFAADEEQVRVGYTWLGSATRSVTCGEGTAAYDPDTKTLTLTNVTINHDYNAAIWNTTDDLTIKLVGENSINSGDQAGILSQEGRGLLTLTGEGSLNITAADGYAIYAYTGSLLVKDTTVKVSSDILAVFADLGIEISGSTFESSTTDGNAIWTRGDLKIEDSNVTTSNDNKNDNAYPAIWCDGNITINGGQLKSTCKGGTALGAASTISITGCTLESASTDGNAIYTPGDLKIENSNVTTNSAGNLPAIWCYGDITINGGQLKSTCIGSDALGAVGALSITDCNVENKGYYTALYSGGKMTLTGGNITAEAERNAIISERAMTITNATVKATAQRYDALRASDVMKINGGSITADAGDNAIISYSAMTITNATVKATAQRHNALRASDVMKINGGRVEATTVLYDEETYAIHMQPLDDGSNDGRMEIGGGVELYVKGFSGIAVGDEATIADAHIVIDSEDWSIDMPVKFAEGCDIALALGGDSMENAEPFDWYSMSLEPFTPGTPGTYPYLELFSGAKHTLRVTNGMISELNGKPYTGNEAEIPAGSPVALTLTVNEDAFTAGEVFSSWTLSPTPRDLQIDGNVITFTMPAENVEIRATGDIPPEPTPDAEVSPLFGLALGAVSGTLVGLTLYTVHELGITQTLRETLPAGAAIPANRCELALLLWNAADKPEPEKQPAFTDVSDLETAKAAQWAIEAGLMETESSGKFAPAKRVTRLKVFRTWKAANH